MLSRLIALFPLWALGFAWMAYVEPGPFLALKGVIVYLLGLVMFGMGLTLTPRSFAAVLHRPTVVALGLALQFLVMPALGWALALAIGLPAQLLAGMVLVGASPGGTASNVICYLARGDVALSITLTAASTLLAVIAASPRPKWSQPHAANTMTRYRVTLSGSSIGTTTRPSPSVTAEGTNRAIA